MIEEYVYHVAIIYYGFIVSGQLENPEIPAAARVDQG